MKSLIAKVWKYLRCAIILAISICILIGSYKIGFFVGYAPDKAKDYTRIDKYVYRGKHVPPLVTRPEKGLSTSLRKVNGYIIGSILGIISFFWAIELFSYYFFRKERDSHCRFHLVGRHDVGDFGDLVLSFILGQIVILFVVVGGWLVFFHTIYSYFYGQL